MTPLSILADAYRDDDLDRFIIEDDEAETLEDAGVSVCTSYDRGLSSWIPLRYVDGGDAVDFINRHDPEHIAEYFQ